MTTLKDIREKLQATLADVDKLEQNLKSGSDPYRFVPKVGEDYWFVDHHGGLDWYGNENDDTDKHLILTGNCYRTKEQAEKALEIINRIGELRGDWLPDWGDKKYKYFPYKKIPEHKWYVGNSNSTESGELYMPTKQAAQTLIDEYGDDLLLVMRRL